MKINNINQGKIKELAGDKNVQSNEKAGSGKKHAVPSRATGDVSSLSRLVSRARIESEKVSEVRPEKVEEAKQKIARGFYDTDEVKSKLVGKLAERLRTIMKR